MWPIVVRTAVRLFSPKWTVGALGILRNEKGEVLFLKHRGRNHPWGLPGGMLKHPETPPEGLCRELQEELGVSIDEDFLTLLAPLTATKLPMLELIYSYPKPLKDSEISKIKIQKFEIAELRWIDLHSLATQEGILARHRAIVDRFLRSAAASHKESKANK